MDSKPSDQEIFFLFTFLFIFLGMAVSWISFARISMARIERDMKRDGLPRPAPWDGVGARALWYATAIVLPVGNWNLPNDPFFDNLTVRRYAKPIDKTIGLALIVTALAGIFLVLVGAWFFDFY